MLPIKKFRKSISEIVFPVCCVCCGVSTNKDGRLICRWCEKDRFEYVSENGNDEIQPETVLGLYSMWYFDKGGYLQQLLHNLKYNYLRNAGIELGSILGRFLINRSDPDSSTIFDYKKPVLIPVPLHKSKLRKRGYNQARALAEGILKVTKWDLADENTVIRVRKTKTQTGLNSAERAKNIQNAFSIKKPGHLQNCQPIIVDDVFTTGATTFELANQIFEETSNRVLIVTVAKA
tara:strand:+ start:10835 stop:11536 length:702 start_codon:yes stop_codon:yes gene_type:complete